MPEPTDVIALLTTDHREAKELLAAAKAAEVLAEKRDLIDTLIGQLVRHSVAEETVVYPVMRVELPDGAEVVEHDTKEHKQLETLMKRLEDHDLTDAEVDGLLDELKAVLDDHVSDEEDEQFPELRAALSPERLEKMGEAVEALKKVAPTRPHPSAPNNALFHLMVGPGVGMVDRLRDKLSGRTTS